MRNEHEMNGNRAMLYRKITINNQVTQHKYGSNHVFVGHHYHNSRIIHHFLLTESFAQLKLIE